MNHSTQDNPPGTALADFRAEMDVFSGPLDLLLHLIKRDEVDVLEVSLSEITDQYLRVLKAMQMFDVNVAAEFLVMAATLMDIKSRTLLPEAHLEDEEEEADPRDQLVRQLLQYKRFREASATLAQMAQQRQKKFSRIPPDEDAEPDAAVAEKLLEDVSVWDLLSAYGEIVRQIELTQPQHIIYDDVPVRVYMDEVMQAMAKSGGRDDFLNLLSRDGERGRLVGVFLAVLELARLGHVVLEQQEGDRSQISITLARRDGEAHGSEHEAGARDTEEI